MDIATGVVYSVHEEINIPGRFPLKWERRYSTALLETKPGALGTGWTASYFATLREVKDGYEFISPEGDIDFFQDLDDTISKGGTIANFSSFQELHSKGNHFIVTQWDVQTYEITRFIFSTGKNGESWPLKRIENITGQGLDLFYDDSGRLFRIHQEIEKRDLVLAYNHHNQITSITLVLADNSRHVQVQYDYDDKQRLATVYNAPGDYDQYAYDSHHRMAREYVKNGAVYEFDYDEQGRCIRTSGTDGYDLKTFRYNDLLGRTEVKNSHGQITLYHWIPETGQVFEEIKPMGAVYKTGYDGFGRIILKTNPKGSVSRYKYDGYGNRCKIINGLEQATEIEFNENHQPVELTNPAGHVWRRYYNAIHQVICIENPQEIRYFFKYDDMGGIIEITDPSGHQLQQKFSPEGLLESATDWKDNLTRYRSDGYGRITGAIDPLGNNTTFQYDVLGNITQIDYADGTCATAQYDASGNLTKVTDRNGHTTRYDYASCNRIVKITDALRNAIELSWDSEPDRLISLTNSQGEVYHYEYNTVGDVVSEIGFDGRELRFEYDLYGNRMATFNGLGERIVFDRDGLGRLICITLPSGEKTIFSYNESGFLAETDNADTKISFERDSLGRMVREIQNGHAIERDFDKLGNIQQLRSDLGLTIDYQFDANNQLEQFTLNGKDSIQLKRDALGLEVQRLLPNQVRLNQQFDAMGRLTEQAVFAHANNPFRSPDDNVFPLIQRNYQYTGENLTQITDRFWGSTTYTYDPLQRLTQTLRNFGEGEQFQFDKNDNITKITRGESTFELTYGSGDRLESKNNTTYIHDDQGRRIQKTEKRPDGSEKIWHYTWDALDQLRSVTNPDGQEWHYAYDPFGRRIKKESSDGIIQSFVWDEDVVLHELNDENESTNWVFDPHSFSPLCKLEGDEFYAVVSDHLGTPRELLDRQGKIVWQVDYNAWGGIRKQKVADTDCPIRFAGQWYDDESGFCYNRFRYYDVETARFISSDPIGLIGGVNQYGYVTDPNLWADPLGLCNKETITDLIKKAKDDEVPYSTGHHVHTGIDVRKIMSNPDAVYLSTSKKNPKLIFRRGGDIVIVGGKGSNRNRVITGYGSSGLKGESGAKALGGNPTDMGEPITHAMVVDGKIPVRPGVDPLPKADLIRDNFGFIDE